MARTREKKKQIVEDLKKKFQAKKSVVLVDIFGVGSAVLFDLRNEFKKSADQFQVVKKTLLQKALEGLNQKGLVEKIKKIEAQIGLGFGFGDEIKPFKVCYQFSQENENLKILGGILGNEFLEKEKVIELAKLPSREELLQKLLGTFQNSIYSLFNVLKANLRNLVFVFGQIKVNQ